MTTQVSSMTFTDVSNFIRIYAPTTNERIALQANLNAFVAEIARKCFGVEVDSTTNDVLSLYADPRMPVVRCIRDSIENGFTITFKIYSPLTPNTVIGAITAKIGNGLSENSMNQYIEKESMKFLTDEDLEAETVTMSDLTESSNPTTRALAARFQRGSDGEREAVFTPTEAKERLQWLRVRNDLSGRARIGKDLYDALDEYEDANRYLDRNNQIIVRFKGDTPQRADKVTIDLSDDGFVFASVTIVYSK